MKPLGDAADAGNEAGAAAGIDAGDGVLDPLKPKAEPSAANGPELPSGAPVGAIGAGEAIGDGAGGAEPPRAAARAAGFDEA